MNKTLFVAAGFTGVLSKLFFGEDSQGVHIKRVKIRMGNSTVNDEDRVGPIVVSIHFGARGYDASFPNPSDPGFRARATRVPDIYFQNDLGDTYQAFGDDWWSNIDETIPVNDLVIGVRNTATIMAAIEIDYDIVTMSEIDSTISRFA